MNSEAQTVAQPAAGTSAPNSWGRVLMGMCSFALLLTLTVMLIVQYLQSRPFDLVTISVNASNAVVDKLLTNRIPEENIVASEPVLSKSPEAHWYSYEYEVRLPNDMELDGVAALIDRTLAPYGAHATEVSSGGASTLLALNIGEHTFASVYLFGGRPQRGGSMAVSATEVQGPSGPLAVPALKPPALEAGLLEGQEAIPTSGAAWEKTAMARSGWVPPRGEDTLPLSASGHAPSIEPILPSASPKLAIIVDDGGYGGQTTDLILSLDPSLTLAILPYTPHAAATAASARELGFEVMLHMPMENSNPRLRHNGQIEVGMSADAIRELVRKALEEVPGAEGINNHMGSKFTTNEQALTDFFDAIEDKSLFFVDSRTAPQSRAYELAREYGLATAYRELFLDHDNGPAAIRKQFEAMVDSVLKNGNQIVIAHFRPNTAKLLQEMLPTLEEKGIELVHVSELVQ